MNHQIAAADERGIGCYLTTAKEANVSFYSRFGFDTVDVYNPTATWPTVWSSGRTERRWRSQ